MAIEFSVADESVDETTHLVVLAGEIDLFTAPEFKARVAEPIDAGNTRVIVDLTAVSFIDSSSLGVLIGAHKRLRLRDGALVIVCDDRAIVNTFKITGLDGVFEIVASRDDALGSPYAAPGEGPMDTGFPTSDAQNDFSRARRQRVLADLGRRLRREPDDVALILPFEEVVEALGRVGERALGLHTVPLDSIVGTVDRAREFDRRFRPLSGRVRGRWERIAAAQRRGESMPPISLYRIGELHFVRDGHHRVSVARTMGRDDIDAYVTEVQTRVGMAGDVRLSDLPLKGHERVFWERVPLALEARAQLRLSDPWDYAALAEGVEAWGFRAMQERLGFLDRAEVARAWFDDEYVPVVRMLAEGGFVAKGETEADAYMRVASKRYRLLRTHQWTPEILERIRRESGSPPAPKADR